MDLKKLLDDPQVNPLAAKGAVNVLVDLRVPEADDKRLRHFASLGLQVREVVKNKLIGSILAEKLAQLRNDPDVADVELAVPLKPHTNLR
jgi:hypothetical protein